MSLPANPVPSAPVPGPGHGRPVEARRAGLRAGWRGPTGRRAAVIALVLAGLGPAVGWLWWRVAPVAQLRIETDGGFYTELQPQQFVAADGWFTVLTAVVGGLAGLVVWWLLRRRPYAAVSGLAVGGVLGAVVAWRVGVALGRVDLAALAGAPVGTVSDVPLRLGSPGLLAAEAVAAMLGWLLADLLLGRRLAAAGTEPISPVDPPPPPWPGSA